MPEGNHSPHWNGQSPCLSFLFGLTISVRQAAVPAHRAVTLGYDKPLRRYADGLQDEDGLKRNKQRTAKDPVLDTAMVSWFAQVRQTGLPISGPVVKAQAEIFNKSINGDETTFVASQGWLWRWQKRHGITKHKIVGEKRSADKDSAAQFPPPIAGIPG